MTPNSFGNIFNYHAFLSFSEASCLLFPFRASLRESTDPVGPSLFAFKISSPFHPSTPYITFEDVKEARNNTIMSWETAGAESRMGNTFEQGGIDGVYGHEGGYDDFGGGGSGAGDHTCFNCGEPGHNKADCPMPRQFSGACNSCGQEGHMSKDCPSAGPMVCRRCNKQGHMARDCDLPVICPRCNENHYVRDCPLPMICRHCEQEGHLARDCPTAPPRVCHNCLEEGHDAATCKAPRKIIRDDVPEHSPEEALKLIREAVEEKDLDDVKAAVQMYVKAIPEITYVELEKLLRAKNIGLFLIGVEKADLSCTLTNMDFQGNLDKKFTVTYRFQSRPSRPREKAVWPANDEENMARLSDGGEPVARGIPLCMNCKELGHISRNCPIEKQEVLDRATVTCYNCGEPGHRTRDCKGPRMDKFACRNCGQSGHSAKDCPEPRSAENVECRKCGEMGHFSRDCPQGGGGGDNTCRNCGQEGHMARDCTEPRKMICRNCDQEGHAARDCPEPRNMAKMKCHNCDEFGHMSRDCPKPRNMERVQCSNCQEMGHFPSTCTANAADTMAMDEFEAGGADATGDAFDSGGGFGGGANTGGGFGAQTNFGTNNGAQECVW